LIALATTNAFITHGGASKAGKRIEAAWTKEQRRDAVSDRHLVNIAALEIGEEVALFH
jgi:hypothetical protein